MRVPRHRPRTAAALALLLGCLPACGYRQCGTEDDRKRQRLVVLGANGDRSQPWEWDGQRWSSPSPDPGPRPSVSDVPSLVFEDGEGVVVAHGVGDGATWVWDGRSFRRRDVGEPAIPVQATRDTRRREILLTPDFGSYKPRSDAYWRQRRGQGRALDRSGGAPAPLHPLPPLTALPSTISEEPCSSSAPLRCS